MWGAFWLYAAGVLTGALLAGWSPEFLNRWEERREERRRRRTTERMKKLVERAAAKIDQKNNL